MELDFSKDNGLLPVIVQHWQTGQVLMLGYMNSEAFVKTVASDQVTFFSRSRNRLWTKGEESGNFLHVKKMYPDCDNDTLLILAEPAGPTCHRGTSSCFDNDEEVPFLFRLEAIIRDRYDNPVEGSYVNRLREKGLNKITQKVGEEATETVIAALAQGREDLLDETSDLVFHLMVLLREKNISLAELGDHLRKRHK
ncbi:phosphoribosyl-ATP pyrophosphatase /phosphoribosyl-AMP cyclohydrolase [Anseongella ginsenosidimutans]|uniref:Histidine biosynthesis bifunctional protein HisIE n=1 Tax=Anseongella ginsenosidimutans TaxID=496056 RepID=A0A4R3KRK9_9SPHI|nr:bifunctional phosphoribosyl-AMP cyclohydrolase/phosphoribosyl-ATP diphosphatase HisIE [Anseongella ginsenosidimutans]QEC52968.1 bifunctional phosphoribosyl-AMP cyclohydrolase/phosphoribosyl-ATP diphosphatase HisIE [Anseongella ginsenosidimutans]TCS87371.1 phosphoribosyl-ATP pyrophosphatase /phosphoribosyl-AMP cyclohydrolase [Anseongella ginsenosidimutans]